MTNKNYLILNSRYQDSIGHQFCPERDKIYMDYKYPYTFCNNLVAYATNHELHSGLIFLEVEPLGEVTPIESTSKTNHLQVLRKIEFWQLESLLSCGDYHHCSHNYGSSNKGYYNYGDYNNGNHNYGCFNTQSACINMFNKPTAWTYQKWLESSACQILKGLPDKSFRFGRDNQIWWNSLSESDKLCIKRLPNFDGLIFKQTTGIDVEIG